MQYRIPTARSNLEIEMNALLNKFFALTVYFLYHWIDHSLLPLMGHVCLLKYVDFVMNI
jgi:hypothetical protein